MKLHEFRECIDKIDDYYQKEEFVEIQGKKFPIAKGDPYICVPVVTEETDCPKYFSDLTERNKGRVEQFVEQLYEQQQTAFQQKEAK